MADLKPALRRMYRGSDGKMHVAFMDAATGELIPAADLGLYNLNSSTDVNTDIGAINIGTLPGDKPKPDTPAVTDTPAANGNPGGAAHNNSFDNQAYQNSIGNGQGQAGTSGTVPGGIGGLLEAAHSIGLFSGGGIIGKLLFGDSGDSTGADGKPVHKAGIEKIWDAVTGGGQPAEPATGLSNTPPSSGTVLTPGDGASTDGAQVVDASAPANGPTPGPTLPNHGLNDGRLAKITVATNGIRNKPVKQELINQLQASVTAVYGPGYTAVIASGAQPEGKPPTWTKGYQQENKTQVGTRRHGTQVAADVRIFAPDGTELKKDQLLPLAQDWYAEKKGSVGFPSDGTNWLHLDLIGGQVPGSVPLQGKESRGWFYGTPSSAERTALSASLSRGITPKYVVDPKQVAQIQMEAATGAGQPVAPQVASPTIPKIPGDIQVAANAGGPNGGAGSVNLSPGSDTRVGLMSQPATGPSQAAGYLDAAENTRSNPIIAKTNTVNVSPNGTERPVMQAGSAQMTGPNKVGEQLANETDAMLTGNSMVAGGTASQSNMGASGSANLSPVQAPQAVSGQPPSAGAQPAPVTSKSSQIEPLTPPTAMAFNAPTDPTQNPVVQTYLGYINKSEGSPKANQLFAYKAIPNDDLSKHPNIRNDKYNTTAAGSYQINNPTWQFYAPKVDAQDFSQESQDKVAWAIASDNYAKKTGGGDLFAALTSKDPSVVATAFSKQGNRWVNMPKTFSAAMTTATSFMSDVSSYDSSVPMPRPRPSQISTGLVNDIMNANHPAGNTVQDDPASTSHEANTADSSMGFASHPGNSVGGDTQDTSTGRSNNKVSPDITGSGAPANHNYPSTTDNVTGDNNTAYNNKDVQPGRGNVQGTTPNVGASSTVGNNNNATSSHNTGFATNPNQQITNSSGQSMTVDQRNAFGGY